MLGGLTATYLSAGDLALLKHDKALSAAMPQLHLRTLPTYLRERTAGTDAGDVAMKREPCHCSSGSLGA